MAVVYNAATRNARLTAVFGQIDAGPSTGVFRITTSGGSTLATFALTKPSATVAAGVLSFLGLPLLDLTAAGTGIAALARVEDSTGVVVISGLTVGTVGTDVILSPSTTITAGQAVTVTAAQIVGN